MIKVIALDFGGVYFTYDYFKLMNEFSKKLNISVEEARKAWQNKLDEFTKGEIKEDEFWDGLLKSIDKKYNKNILHKIVIDQFKPIKEMQFLLDKLKIKYKVILFTNQTDWIYELNKKFDFFKEFDAVLVSRDVGFQKPEKEFFELLIKNSDCDPTEIIFVDDTHNYGKLAKKMGMKFIHFQNQNQLEQELRKLGVTL